MSEIPVGEHVCSRIRRAHQALMAHHEAVLRRYGLTMAQYMVLLSLSRDEPMSGAQLARACGGTQQSMATVLAGMQSKGLIARQPSAVHAKVMIASLTAAGRELFDAAGREVVVLEQELAECFTGEEYERFCEFLDRATGALVERTP